MCDEVEIVKGICYFGNRLNASGGCKAAVTARIRLRDGEEIQRVWRDIFGKRYYFADESKGIFQPLALPI